LSTYQFSQIHQCADLPSSRSGYHLLIKIKTCGSADYVYNNDLVILDEMQTDH
jgi:hypothetical protein